MKVYVVLCQVLGGYNNYSSDNVVGSIEYIFTSEEKAKEYILECYPPTMYNEEDDTYDPINRFGYYYEIQEWEVE